MARVKRGVAGRRRHKKIIHLTAGHKGQRHRLFRRANESLIHAMDYSTRDRLDRKGDFRRLWIMRINAAVRSAWPVVLCSSLSTAWVPGRHRCRPQDDGLTRSP